VREVAEEKWVRPKKGVMVLVDQFGSTRENLD